MLGATRKQVIKGGIIGDKITEVGGGVMVQIRKGLKDYGRDLGLYPECSERPLEDYILIRLLKDLEGTMPSCKCDLQCFYLPAGL